MIKLEIEEPVEPNAIAASKEPAKAVALPTTKVASIICFIIGAVFGFLLADSSLFRSGEERKHDEKENVIPDENNDHKSVPKLANAWVVIVEESSQRTPQVARVLADSKYWDSLGARKIKWRLYDKDATQAASFKEAAEKAGYPALLILTQEPGAAKSTLVAAKPCPPTTDTIDELVRKVTGL